MRSDKSAHGARARVGAFAVSAALTVGIAGCSGGGHGSGSAAGHVVPTLSAGATSGAQTPTATGSSSGTAATDAEYAQAPAAFAHPPKWSLPVTLSHNGLAEFGNPILPNAVATNAFDLMADQVKMGMIAVIGNVVAVPSFGAPADMASSTPSTLSVEFLDGAAGKTLATVPIPDPLGYYGMDAVTIGGKNAVEVRYEPKPTGANTAQFASVLLDQSGTRLWSSVGQQLAGPVTSYNGLVGDQNTGFVRQGGFVVRVADPDPLDTRRTKSVVSVLDLSGRTVLTVPNTIPGNPASHGVEVVGGYAVESSFTASSNPSGVSKPIPIHVTVFDLAHGAKQVAALIQSMDPQALLTGGWPHVLAACGNRLLMQWPRISQSYSAGTSSADLAVLDLATGRIAAPVAVPSDVVGGTLIPRLGTINSPDCLTVWSPARWGSVARSRSPSTGPPGRRGGSTWVRPRTVP